MNIKQILMALAITTILVGSTCAAGVNDFKVDGSYNNAFSSDYYSVYLNGNGDAGVAIYLNNARMPRLLEVGDELHSLGILLYFIDFYVFFS